MMVQIFFSHRETYGMTLQAPPPSRYYYEKLGSPVNNDFACCGSLTISIDQNHVYTKDGFHGHDYYELVYIRSGDGINIINKTSYPVTRGNIVLLRLSGFHAYHSFNNMEECRQNREEAEGFASDCEVLTPDFLTALPGGLASTYTRATALTSEENHERQIPQ